LPARQPRLGRHHSVRVRSELRSPTWISSLVDALFQPLVRKLGQAAEEYPYLISWIRWLLTSRALIAVVVRGWALKRPASIHRCP